MGRGALVLYLWTEENHEVAGGAGLPFGNERELIDQMRAVLAMSDEQRQKLRDAAVQRVRDRYSWDAVTSRYERLFESLVHGARAS
jgi:glycosyltransferase involved in cell wall biosynthesis